MICADCHSSGRPCAAHVVNELWDEGELVGVKFDELAIVTQSLLVALKDCQRPDHRIGCGTCVHAIQKAEREMRRLGAVTK